MGSCAQLVWSFIIVRQPYAERTYVGLYGRTDVRTRTYVRTDGRTFLPGLLCHLSGDNLKCRRNHVIISVMLTGLNNLLATAVQCDSCRVTFSWRHRWTFNGFSTSSSSARTRSRDLNRSLTDAFSSCLHNVHTNNRLLRLKHGNNLDCWTPNAIGCIQLEEHSK